MTAVWRWRHEDFAENFSCAGGAGADPVCVDLYRDCVCVRFGTGLVSAVIGLLGIGVLLTYSPKNGIILLGKVQALRYLIQDWIYG